MDAIIIILDVGPSASQKHDGKCFLEEAKKCASKILQRKMYSESKDEVALILMGTQDTQNPLYSKEVDPDEYKHISIARPLAKVNFETIEFVEKYIKPTNHEADWVDALVVAVNFARESVKGKKIEALKIVMMTDFAGPFRVGNLDTIVEGMKRMDIEFMVVGADLAESDENGVNGSQNGHGGDHGEDHNQSFIGKPKSKTQIASEKTAREIIEKVEGKSATFETIERILQFFAKKEVRSGTWNAQLEIGKTFAIPVTGFYTIKEAKVKTWGKGLATDWSERPGITRSHRLQTADEDEIATDELSKAYQFGADTVVVQMEEMGQMQYESGEKAFQAIAFVNRSSIPYHHHLGDGTMYFVARKGDAVAAKALSALAHAMDEADTAMIGRKVYRKNSTPQMGFAIPLFEESGDVLAWIPLPYAEDIRPYKFPSLDDSKDVGKVTKKEYDLIDELIKTRDLSDEDKLREEGKFTYNSKDTVNPIMQRLYACLTYRGLRPDDPLPENIGNDLGRLVQPEASKELENLAEELRQAFPLSEVEKKNRWARTGAETFGKGENEEPDEKKPKVDTDATDSEPFNVAFGGAGRVTEIRSVHPVEDFKAMLHQLGKDPSKMKVEQVLQKMQRMILEFLTKSLGSSFYRKSADCVKALREESIGRDPKGFNEWLREFKDTLYAEKRDDFWRDFVLDQTDMGLITTEETSESDVTPADAEAFFKEKSVVETPDQETAAEEPAGEDEIDDLI